jgi:hypothetical protein
LPDDGREEAKQTSSGNSCQKYYETFSRRHEHHLATVVKGTIKHLVNETNIIWQQLSKVQ